MLNKKYLGSPRLTHYILTVCILLIITYQSASALIIDDFNGSQQLSSELERITSTAGLLPKTTTQRLNSLGGHRKILIEGLSGTKNTKTRLLVENGRLIHSQDAGVAGISRIIWDADSSKPEENKHNLGAYNLTADGSTKILAEILTYDSPANLGVSLEFKIYNGSKTFVVLRREIDQAISKSKFLEFPFKDFKAGSGSTGSFSLQKISSIELQIYGLDPDVDLQLAAVKTDTCDYLPNINNMVVDSCGVCNGNNTVCRDCQGTLNGKAKKDRCGVCNGNGQSCLGCNIKDQSELLGQLDFGIVEQEKLIKQLSNKILKVKSTPQLQKFLEGQKALANELQVKGWRIVWQLPISTSVCTNQNFCNSHSVQNLIAEYQSITAELRKIAETLIKRLQKLSTGNAREHITFGNRNELLYSQNLEKLRKVPDKQSVCS